MLWYVLVKSSNFLPFLVLPLLFLLLSFFSVEKAFFSFPFLQEAS
jgi:hypothetical protein